MIAPDLRVLFCGINPSLMSAARGHHFARPGNRFWPAIDRQGVEYALGLALGFEDRRGRSHLIAEGEALVRRAQETAPAADSPEAHPLRPASA